MTEPQGRLGTFGGVFTPTLLTILGVIMYLRLGWVVGNGGLIGAFMVMGLAIGITTCTGLALSSISTNTRLGAGGPYAIISRSLGLEVGGSVGVPLFISQALAVAMYIFGFREGWLWFFPDHNALLVDLVTFALVFVIAYMSAELAFKVQYGIMAVIVLSIVLILASPAGWTGDIQWTGTWRGSPENGFAGTDFWAVFAVFFPAATGIMAGANMSGDLAHPRRAIPVGTISALVVSTVIYGLLAVWLSRAGTPEELTSNYTFLVDASLWGPGVLAGLLGATLSSALSSLVGAPRILLALVRDGIVPNVGGIGDVAANREPRRAMIASGLLVVGGLLLRDLNAIAPLLSMFFLITYGVINVVVLLEGSLGLQSYRPTLKIPRLVPLLGAVGCVFAGARQAFERALTCSLQIGEATGDGAARANLGLLQYADGLPEQALETLAPSLRASEHSGPVWQLSVLVGSASHRWLGQDAEAALWRARLDPALLGRMYSRRGDAHGIALLALVDVAGDLARPTPEGEARVAAALEQARGFADEASASALRFLLAHAERVHTAAR